MMYQFVTDKYSPQHNQDLRRSVMVAIYHRIHSKQKRILLKSTIYSQIRIVHEVSDDDYQPLLIILLDQKGYTQHGDRNNVR